VTFIHDGSCVFVGTNLPLVTVESTVGRFGKNQNFSILLLRRLRTGTAGK
jgi:hypothetical protein